MKVTPFTRKALAVRREVRDLTKDGWEQITATFGEGRLWELDRGFRTHHRITDIRIGADGKSIWWKAAPTE